MNLSISNIAWDQKKDSKIYSLLKKYKYNGIEIAPTIWFPESPYDQNDEAHKISRELKNTYDLSIFSIQSICYGKNENFFNSVIEFNYLLGYLKKAIDFAYSIGCPNIVFGCPKNRIIESENQIGIALDFFNKLGDYATSRNVFVSIEPNPTIYGTNFLNTTEQTIDFIKTLNHPNIKLNVDLGTMIYNNESLDILRNNSELIGHIHLSEPYLKLIKVNELHYELFKFIKDIKYTKCVSIEMKKQGFDDLSVTIKNVSEAFYDIK